VIGVRVNPGISTLAASTSPIRRAGIRASASIDLDELSERRADSSSGLMFHFNCENDDAGSVCGVVAAHRRPVPHQLLHSMRWVSLGGGIAFTSPGYDLDQFCDRAPQRSPTTSVCRSTSSPAKRW
jgi:carboxynorspermidine decarboxylase